MKHYIVLAVFIMTKLKIWEVSLLCALCVSLLAGTWAQTKQEDIASSLIRLHVVAVSDDKTEQEIKLRVRDEVLNCISPELENVKSANDAESIIREKLGEIQRAAAREAEGRKVTVSLGEEYYPTRHYEGFSLPAGRYSSLRIILGEGKGHNWWCVVFPPLCVSAAEQEKALDTMSGDDRAILTEADGYVVKFRVLELWGELMEKLGQH